MIVYGDPQFRVSLSVFARRLRALLDEVESSGKQQGKPMIDAARRLLIACGQCEQGIEDACGQSNDSALLPPRCRESIRQATDAAAEMLLVAFCGSSEANDATASPRCRAALDGLIAQGAPDLPLTIKAPEGYAFYLIYPEQYLLAARKWLAENGGKSPGNVVVIGLRSIGTGLSAVVAATLKQDRRVGAVCRATVRPHGHPFSREVSLPDDLRAAHPESSYALVVDEGPGLSGSSMTAAYAALSAAGFAVERIAFLPGHGGLPGEQGGERVAQVWATTPSYVASADELRWDGESLTERIMRRSRELAAPAPRSDFQVDSVTPSELCDIGGGAWRDFAYPRGDQSGWPAVAPQFERPKYLWRRNGANQGGIFWAFAGLSETLDASGLLTSRDVAAESRMNNHALSETNVPAIAMEAGFVASPWVSGIRLRVGARQLRPEIAWYCAAASLPALNSGEELAAWERLQEMLYWNTKERLGDSAAETAASLATAARIQADAIRGIAAIPAYGDGRMAMHEWVSTSQGKTVKTDCAGHETDHTIIGRQPIWWDMAAILVEWQPAPMLRENFWREVQRRVGINRELSVAPGSVLARFYLASYAAFRVGVLTMAGERESERCGLALGEYDGALKQALCIETVLRA